MCGCVNVLPCKNVWQAIRYAGGSDFPLIFPGKTLFYFNTVQSIVYGLLKH